MSEKQSKSLKSAEAAPESEPKASKKKVSPRPPVVVVTHGKRFEVPAEEWTSLEDFLRLKYPEECKD